MTEKIIETIKTARRKLGLTQQQLGEKLGYTGNSASVTVQRWEAGKRPVPLEKLRALSAALQIPLDSLIP